MASTPLNYFVEVLGMLGWRNHRELEAEHNRVFLWELKRKNAERTVDSGGLAHEALEGTRAIKNRSYSCGILQPSVCPRQSGTEDAAVKRSALLK